MRNEGQFPYNQFNIRSTMDLRNNYELDLFLYSNSGLTNPTLGVRKWNRLDIRLGKRQGDKRDISFGVRNLFNNGQKEFFTDAQDVITPAEFSVYGQVSSRF